MNVQYSLRIYSLIDTAVIHGRALLTWNILKVETAIMHERELLTWDLGTN